MRKLLLFLFLAGLAGTTIFAQVLPNRSFEYWDTLEAFEYPSNWNSSNADAYGYLGEVNVLEDGDAFHEDASLYMETLVADSDTVIGFILLEGWVDEDSTGGLEFDGGVALSGAPDSLVGWFKHDIPAGDSAWVLILFEESDTILGMNLHKIGGSASSWTRYAFAVDSMPIAPDTVIVGFTSGDPDNAAADGWMMVDSLAWIGIPDTIPNYSFEEWESLEYVDPEDWKTWNYFSSASGDDESAVRTADAHSGDWAIEVYDVFFDEPERNMSLLTVGDYPGPEGLKGGIEWNEPITNASGWYKYDPAMPTDSGLVLIVASKWDPIGDSTMYLGWTMHMLGEATSWTKFEFEVEYDTSMIPDTLNVVFAATRNSLFEDSMTAGGSVLILDDIWVGTECNYTDTLELFALDDTSVAFPGTVLLEPEEGDYWEDYLWSDGSTADTLLIDSVGIYEITLEVADSNGCEVWDSIHVSIYAVPGFEDELINGLTIYPNPGSGILFFKWEEMPLGLVNLQVTDINGRVQLSREIDPVNENRLMVDQLSAGVYFLRVNADKKANVYRIVIK